MASTTLYPPVVDTFSPAFVASGNGSFCRIYFSLSRLSTSSQPIRGVHLSIIKQKTGQSVVNKIDNPSLGRYRATGAIFINSPPTAVPNEYNHYYVDILNEDIKDGWVAGWVYKIQIRLSTVVYDGNIGQSAWLNLNAHNFSEWSTYCTTKAIGNTRVTVPIMKGYDSATEENNGNVEKIYNLFLSTLDFTGSYYNDDLSEILYSYNLRLYDNQSEKLIEESGELYSNQFYNPNQFRYLFKTNLEDGKTYKIVFRYETINKYKQELSFIFTINQTVIKEISIYPITIENISGLNNQSFIDNFNNSTTLELEKDEARIGIKFFANNSNPYNGNICLRRADSRDNFTTWTDIKIVSCVNTIINNLPIVFDYTIESGVWYKYGVQSIDTTGTRGVLNIQKTVVLREFSYSYLLGDNGKQLKLNLSNTLSSYSYAIAENKTDTIGGKYPFISRNGNMKYRTFPLGGIISYNMDDQNTFTNEQEIYQHEEIVHKYQERRVKENFDLYDYKREYDFREAVLEFLQDGKPKLFKSATEGNIIVRLLQVAAQPNQALNRMIHNFSATAYEIADATMENYHKYGFYAIGEWSTDFSVYKTKLGQLDIDFNVGDNIIEKIWEKYNYSTQNLAGNRVTLKKVHHLSVEFTDKPLRILNNSYQEVLGNNLLYGSTKITIYNNHSRFYYFDENIEFTKGSTLTVLGGLDDTQKVHITVDFLYELGEEPYIEKEIETRTSYKNIGQIYNTYNPNDNIYNEIYYKYYYEWKKEFRRLNKIVWTCIEANPGAVFQIVDETDDISNNAQTMYHEINQTGVLNLEGLGVINGLKYVGLRDPSTGKIDKTKSCDVIIDYIYYIIEGSYKDTGE